ncbi:MAG: hypothetical protein IBX56_11800 [Methylomicrobium sp.]|nr:hypothetical protein [Methylomicrobium sp.]
MERSNKTIARWKKQYLDEQRSEFTQNKISLDADKRLIEELKKELAESREDVHLLKKRKRPVNHTF